MTERCACVTEKAAAKFGRWLWRRWTGYYAQPDLQREVGAIMEMYEGRFDEAPSCLDEPETAEQPTHKPTDEEIGEACRWRHGPGFDNWTVTQRAEARAEAREWLRAWIKVRDNETPEAAR